MYFQLVSKFVDLKIFSRIFCNHLFLEILFLINLVTLSDSRGL